MPLLPAVIVQSNSANDLILYVEPFDLYFLIIYCNIVYSLKRQTKIAADDILIVYFYLSKKIRLDFSCESSSEQRIHLKDQVLFSLKNNEKIFMNVVCCSRDWRFKG